MKLAPLDSTAELFTDMGVVTIRNAADLGYFTSEFLKAIAEHRHLIRLAQKDMVPA